MFNKVLIANRGLIAANCVKAVKELGATAAVVYEGNDRNSTAVRSADEAWEIGGPDGGNAYADARAVADLAARIGADAVHPGYGFLAQDLVFARLLREKGITLIAPALEGDRDFTNKQFLKDTAARCGLVPIPGSGLQRTWSDAERTAHQIGYPLLVKAVHGYGGRGIRIANNAGELKACWEHVSGQCRKQGIPEEIFLERYLAGAKHIEFPVLRDRTGRVVVLPELEATVQRRFQKLLVETPSPSIDNALRGRIEAILPTLLSTLGLVGLASVEFLVHEGQAYFIEVNSYLQPSHTATGLLTGLDIIREQIRLHSGEGLAITVPKVSQHIIGCYILALDPENKFAPSPGRIDRYWPPSGDGISVQSAVAAGDTVGVVYDPMITKLVVRDSTREAAIRRMRVALSNFYIDGIQTTLPLMRAIVGHPDFVANRFTTGYLFSEEKRAAVMEILRTEEGEETAAILAALTLAQDSNSAQILEAAAKAQPTVWNFASRWFNRKKMEL